jgi:hypothetical protein
MVGDVVRAFKGALVLQVRGTLRTVPVVFATVLLLLATFEQVSSAADEVVSIRRSAPESYGFFTPTGDGFRAGKSTAKLLIETAYRIQSFQLSGGPGCASSDEFDVIVKADHAINSTEVHSVHTAPYSLGAKLGPAGTIWPMRPRAADGAGPVPGAPGGVVEPAPKLYRWNRTG